MKPMILATMLAGLCCPLTALCQGAPGPTMPNGEPAYLAETNDMFSVCTFDSEQNVLLRWKGVRIHRNELPKASAGNFVRVYERGNRPVYDKNSPEALNPPSEYYHHYGPPPSVVEDLNPPLTSRRNRKGEVILGFVHRNRFLAVTNLGEVAVSSPLLPHEQIIAISMPSNRVDDVRRLAETLSGHGHTKRPGDGQLKPEKPE